MQEETSEREIFHRVHGNGYAHALRVRGVRYWIFLRVFRWYCNILLTYLME